MKMSPRAQKALENAEEECKKSGSSEVLPEHLLLAILKNADGLGYIFLRNIHVNILSLQLMLEKRIETNKNPSPARNVPVSRRLQILIDRAAFKAASMKNNYIGTEHFVAAAFQERNSPLELAVKDCGITYEQFAGEIKSVQEHFISSAPQSAQNNQSFSFDSVNLRDFPEGANGINRGSGSFQPRANRQSRLFIDEFSRDLTALSREGKLDPVIGQKDVIERVIQILSRRGKNNPVLIGEPGVGKTAIAEGLAQKIAAQQVPFNLLKKRILSLDFAAIVAGTKYRGDFEERMKRILTEVKESSSIILFIDEIHTIIGAGGPEGAMDASNILKPALSRGEIQVIGATTSKEYRKYFEKDSALERRFQIVKVSEPSVEDTIKILEGIKKKYEDFHGVIYDKGVIPAIVKFSVRYISDRYLPDKAIDLLDESGSARKIREDERPAELADLEKSIEKLSAEKKSLVANQEYENAAIVRDKVKDLRVKLDEFKNYWQNNSSLSKKHVTVSDICSVVSKSTGIPVEQLDSNESKRLLDMESELHKTVIAQDEAVKLLCDTIRRSRSGVSSSNRPIGSFIFLGPTGVGKTLLAKSLAKFLFGSEKSLIRIDMSDYMEKHNASRLVGAPPGYIGYDEGGILTERVRKNPYSVILLDEIEKAHTDVFNLLLQLLEEGELADNFGHNVNFKNTVIIMTSNAGARQITSEGKVGFSSFGGDDFDSQVIPFARIKAEATAELKRVMSPELLNRIDDIVVFNALNREQISKIIDIQIKELEERLAEKNIKLIINQSARDYLLDNGYEVNLGARPMRRLIQNEIESPLADLILQSGNEKTGEVLVSLEENKIIVRFAGDCGNKINAEDALLLKENQA